MSNYIHHAVRRLWGLLDLHYKDVAMADQLERVGVRGAHYDPVADRESDSHQDRSDLQER
jgi:hypothetical protein